MNTGYVRSVNVRLPAPSAWSASGKLQYSLAPLAAETAYMRAPVIRKIWYRFNGSITTGATAGQMKFFLHHITKLRLMDNAAPRIDIEGPSWHKILHREMPGYWRDGDTVPNGTGPITV